MVDTVSKRDLNVRKTALLEGLFSLLLSTICITINSKFSFLYAFHDADDVHCFITVARCMQRGDVLYRDVYEHKGPMHYFLYYLGVSRSGKGLTGIWLIEIIFFALFLYFAIKTLKLFIKNKPLIYCITMIAGVWATSRASFCGGGECEEFALPFLIIALYYAIKPFTEIGACENDKNVPWIYSVIAGACFGMVFWSKYTVSGAFIGYALSVIIIGILHKDLRYIMKSGLGFLAGTFIVSIPVIVYFGAHKAFDSLWEVYFYNLIFKYSKKDLGSNGFVGNLKSMMKIWLIISLTGVISARKKKLRYEGKIFIVLMILFELIGLSVGKTWGYAYEPIYAFTVFLAIGIICAVDRIININGVNHHFNRFSEMFRSRIRKELEEKPKLKSSIRTIFSEKRQTTTIVLGILLLLYTCYAAYNVSMFTSYIGIKREEYARVQMSELILARVPEDPVIVCFSSLDPGLYYLTGTYPPDKYFCKYNLFSPRELGFYEKYLETGIADYVVAYRPVDDIGKYGYQLVYEKHDVYTVTLSGGPDSFYLYERNGIADKRMGVRPVHNKDIKNS